MSSPLFDFSVGDVVLAEWGKKVFYAKILSMDFEKCTCRLLFDDDSNEEVEFSRIHSVNETTAEIVCVVCKEDSTSTENEIVLCDICSVGFHQRCHEPTIPDRALEYDTPWTCCYCLTNTVNPHIEINPFDKEHSETGWPEENTSAKQLLDKEIEKKISGVDSPKGKGDIEQTQSFLRKQSTNQSHVDVQEKSLFGRSETTKDACGKSPGDREKIKNFRHKNSPRRAGMLQKNESVSRDTAGLQALKTFDDFRRFHLKNRLPGRSRDADEKNPTEQTGRDSEKSGKVKFDCGNFRKLGSNDTEKGEKRENQKKKRPVDTEFNCRYDKDLKRDGFQDDIKTIEDKASSNKVQEAKKLKELNKSNFQYSKLHEEVNKIAELEKKRIAFRSKQKEIVSENIDNANKMTFDLNVKTCDRVEEKNRRKSDEYTSESAFRYVKTGRFAYRPGSLDEHRLKLAVNYKNMNPADELNAVHCVHSDASGVVLKNADYASTSSTKRNYSFESQTKRISTTDDRDKSCKAGSKRYIFHECYRPGENNTRKSSFESETERINTKVDKRSENNTRKSSAEPETGRRKSSFEPETERRKSSFEPETERRKSSFEPETERRKSSFEPETERRNSSFESETGRRKSSFESGPDRSKSSFGLGTNKRHSFEFNTVRRKSSFESRTDGRKSSFESETDKNNAKIDKLATNADLKKGSKNENVNNAEYFRHNATRRKSSFESGTGRRKSSFESGTERNNSTGGLLKKIADQKTCDKKQRFDNAEYVGFDTNRRISWDEFETERKKSLLECQTETNDTNEKETDIKNGYKTERIDNARYFPYDSEIKSSFGSETERRKSSFESETERSKSSFEFQTERRKSCFESQTERRKSFEPQTERRKSSFESQTERRKSSFESETERRQSSFESQNEGRKSSFESETERRNSFESQTERRQSPLECQSESNNTKDDQSVAKDTSFKTDYKSGMFDDTEFIRDEKQRKSSIEYETEGNNFKHDDLKNDRTFGGSLPSFYEKCKKTTSVGNETFISESIDKPEYEDISDDDFENDLVIDLEEGDITLQENQGTGIVEKVELLESSNPLEAKSIEKKESLFSVVKSSEYDSSYLEQHNSLNKQLSSEGNNNITSEMKTVVSPCNVITVQNSSSRYQDFNSDLTLTSSKDFILEAENNEDSFMGIRIAEVYSLRDKSSDFKESSTESGFLRDSKSNNSENFVADDVDSEVGRSNVVHNLSDSGISEVSHLLKEKSSGCEESSTKNRFLGNNKLNDELQHCEDEHFERGPRNVTRNSSDSGMSEISVEESGTGLSDSAGCLDKQGFVMADNHDEIFMEKADNMKEKADNGIYEQEKGSKRQRSTAWQRSSFSERSLQTQRSSQHEKSSEGQSCLEDQSSSSCQRSLHDERSSYDQRSLKSLSPSHGKISLHYEISSLSQGSSKDQRLSESQRLSLDQSSSHHEKSSHNESFSKNQRSSFSPKSLQHQRFSPDQRSSFDQQSTHSARASQNQRSSQHETSSQSENSTQHERLSNDQRSSSDQRSLDNQKSSLDPRSTPNQRSTQYQRSSSDQRPLHDQISKLNQRSSPGQMSSQSERSSQDQRSSEQKHLAEQHKMHTMPSERQKSPDKQKSEYHKSGSLYRRRTSKEPQPEPVTFKTAKDRLALDLPGHNWLVERLVNEHKLEIKNLDTSPQQELKPEAGHKGKKWRRKMKAAKDKKLHKVRNKDKLLEDAANKSDVDSIEVDSVDHPGEESRGTTVGKMMDDRGADKEGVSNVQGGLSDGQLSPVETNAISADKESVDSRTEEIENQSTRNQETGKSRNASFSSEGSFDRYSSSTENVSPTRRDNIFSVISGFKEKSKSSREMSPEEDLLVAENSEHDTGSEEQLHELESKEKDFTSETSVLEKEKLEFHDNPGRVTLGYLSASTEKTLCEEDLPVAQTKETSGADSSSCDRSEKSASRCESSEGKSCLTKVREKFMEKTAQENIMKYNPPNFLDRLRHDSLSSVLPMRRSSLNAEEDIEPPPKLRRFSCPEDAAGRTARDDMLPEFLNPVRLDASSAGKSLMNINLDTGVGKFANFKGEHTFSKSNVIGQDAKPTSGQTRDFVKSDKERGEEVSGKERGEEVEILGQYSSNDRRQSIEAPISKVKPVIDNLSRSTIQKTPIDNLDTRPSSAQKPNTERPSSGDAHKVRPSSAQNHNTGVMMSAQADKSKQICRVRALNQEKETVITGQTVPSQYRFEKPVRLHSVHFHHHDHHIHTPCVHGAPQNPNMNVKLAVQVDSSIQPSICHNEKHRIVESQMQSARVKDNIHNMNLRLESQTHHAANLRVDSRIHTSNFRLGNHLLSPNFPTSVLNNRQQFLPGQARIVRPDMVSNNFPHTGHFPHSPAMMNREPSMNGMPLCPSMQLPNVNIHEKDLQANNLHVKSVLANGIHEKRLLEQNLQLRTLHDNSLHEKPLHGQKLHGNSVLGNDFHGKRAHEQNLHGRTLIEHDLHKCNTFKDAPNGNSLHEKRSHERLSVRNDLTHKIQNLLVAENSNSLENQRAMFTNQGLPKCNNSAAENSAFINHTICSRSSSRSGSLESSSGSKTLDRYVESPADSKLSNTEEKKDILCRILDDRSISNTTKQELIQFMNRSGEKDKSPRGHDGDHQPKSKVPRFEAPEESIIERLHKLGTNSDAFERPVVDSMKTAGGRNEIRPSSASRLQNNVKNSSPVKQSAFETLQRVAMNTAEVQSDRSSSQAVPRLARTEVQHPALIPRQPRQNERTNAESSTLLSMAFVDKNPMRNTISQGNRSIPILPELMSPINQLNGVPILQSVSIAHANKHNVAIIDQKLAAPMEIPNNSINRNLPPFKIDPPSLNNVGNMLSPSQGPLPLASLQPIENAQFTMQQINLLRRQEAAMRMAEMQQQQQKIQQLQQQKQQQQLLHQQQQQQILQQQHLQKQQQQQHMKDFRLFEDALRSFHSNSAPVRQGHHVFGSSINQPMADRDTMNRNPHFESRDCRKIKEACEACGREAQFVCSRCKAGWYCSESCQIKNWRDHSSSCKRTTPA